MTEIFITYKKTGTFPDEVSETCQDISLANFSFLLDFLLANGEKTCVLTGNEPLLHNQLDELLAIAQKKRIFIILETGGLSGEHIKELILKYRPALRWKIYHPSIYPKDEGNRLLENLSNIAHQNIVLREISLIIHNFYLDFNFFSSILQERCFSKVNIEINPKAFRGEKRAGIEELKGLTSGLLRLMEKIPLRRTRVTLGCCVYPCIFSDAEFGFLSKMGVVREKCLPHLGVLPDLRVYHCRALIHDAKRDLFSLGNLSEAMNYFFERFGELQRGSFLFEECKQCLSCSARFCYGGCLAEKEVKALEEIRVLIQELKTQEKATTWLQLGKHYSQLEKIPEAEEAFLAAKRLSPLNAQVCLKLARILRRRNKFAEAEKEYKEVLCLQPQNTSIIVELSRLFCEQAKFDQAIALLEKAMNSGQTNAAIYFELANNYMKKGMHHNAQLMFEQIRQSGQTI